MKSSLTFFGSILLLSACSNLGPQGYKKQPIEEISEAEMVQKEIPQLSNEKNEKLRKKPKSEIFKGSGPNLGSLSREEQRHVTSREGKYTLNFESAELSEVVKVILGDTLHANYTINPKVTGKVSLQTSRPLSEDELLPTLEMLLQANSAALLKSGDIYRIEPSSGAVNVAEGARLAFPGEQLPVGFQVRIIPLRYVSAKEMQDVLKPMISGATLLRADSARNLLMLAGTETELQSIQETVALFDVNYMQGMSFGIFPLAYVDPVSADKELAEIFNYSNGGNMEEMFRTVPIERLNAIVVITPQPSYLDMVAAWIERLDKINTTNAGGVNVYRVQHVKAVDLAMTLSDIFMATGGTASTIKGPSVAAGRIGTQIGSGSQFGTGSQFGSGSQFGTGSQFGSGSQRRSSMSSTGFSVTDLDSSPASSDILGAIADNTGATSSSSARSSDFLGAINDNTGVTSSSTGGASSSSLSAASRGGSRAGAVASGARVGNMGDVRIIPDEGNNSLIIVAAAQDYEVIRNVIKQLDVTPMQVHIEASILGVDLTDDLKYGVEWKFKNSLPGGENGLGIIGAVKNLSFEGFTGAATGGFSYLISDSNVDAIVRALKDTNKLTVISSPSLLVLNNQQAKIQVGDQIPVRTSQTSTIPTTPVSNVTPGNINNNIFNSSGIEMIDTGVRLTVIPRVNSGGMVLMDIEQNVDTAKTTTTSGIDSPTILKRAITSSVAIASGQTVLLGGLIAEQDTDNKNGVPWLMDIPYIGDLFSTSERKKIRNELIVLITPTVVSDMGDARAVTQEYQRKMPELYYELPKMKNPAAPSVQ